MLESLIDTFECLCFIMESGRWLCFLTALKRNAEEVVLTDIGLSVYLFSCVRKLNHSVVTFYELTYFLAVTDSIDTSPQNRWLGSV